MSPEEKGYQPREEIETSLDTSKALLQEMGFSEEQLRVKPERRSQDREGFHTELIIPQAEPREIIDKVEAWLKSHGSEKITEDMLCDIDDNFNYYYRKGEPLPKSHEFLKQYLGLPVIDPEMPIIWGHGIKSNVDNDIQRAKKLHEMKHFRSSIPDGAYTIRLMDVDNLNHLPHESRGETNKYREDGMTNYPNSPLKSPTVPEFLLWHSHKIRNREFHKHDVYSKVFDTVDNRNGSGYSFLAGIPKLNYSFSGERPEYNRNDIRSGRILIISMEEELYPSNNGLEPLVVVPVSMKETGY